MKVSKKPLDLKHFFANYDFEVDADMMQEKIFSIYQHSAENSMPVKRKEKATNAVKGIQVTQDMTYKISPQDHATHFHQSQAVPHAQLTPDTRKVCKKTHDLRSIFRNFDFEVDADKMQEKIHQLHEKQLDTNNKKPVAKSSDESGPPRRKGVDLRTFLPEGATDRLNDIHGNVSADDAVQTAPVEAYGQCTI